MTEKGYTPGPWTINRTGSTHPARDDYVAIDGGGWYALAEVPVKADRDPCAEGEANARLIAAAPDLLEALIACRNQFDFYAREHRKADKHDKAETNERFAFLATQAIAKAHGDHP